MADASGIIEKVCSGLGCGVYGHGEVSLLPDGNRVQQELLDGGRLVRLSAALRAAGYETEKSLLAALEECAAGAENLNADGILGVRVELPAVMAERREDGYAAFEARCFIWLVE